MQLSIFFILDRSSDEVEEEIPAAVVNLRMLLVVCWLMDEHLLDGCVDLVA